jgi:hypothetical protein
MNIAGRIEVVKDLETLSVQAAELIADHIRVATRRAAATGIWPISINCRGTR